jgi:hypothetical protein
MRLLRCGSRVAALFGGRIMRPVTFRIACAAVALLIALATTPASAQYWSGLWRDPEVENYELSMEKVRKVVDVLRAVTSDAKAMAKIDRDFKELTKTKPKPTVADVSALMERDPVVRNAISKAGLTTREYLLSSSAVANAGLHMTLRSQSQTAGPPLTAAQKANVALLEKHREEWQKIEEEFKRIAEKTIKVKG